MSEAQSNETGLEEAIRVVGSQTLLAQRLTSMLREDGEKPIRQGHISKWLLRANRLPAEVCPAIEVISGVSRKRLRPADWQRIWPELVDEEC